MTTVRPGFSEVPVPVLGAEVAGLLPHQGSLELQNDQPGKTHNWHRHSITEELFVLTGQVVLFWLGEPGRQERVCPAGTWITLPAGTTHGSTAGPDGAIYMIRPQDGATAQTEFLDPAQYPPPATP